jgi:hypothetical protein
MQRYKKNSKRNHYLQKKAGNRGEFHHKNTIFNI